MVIERIKNTTKNTLWGFLSKCITIVLPFITRTVFIHVFGVEYLGLNSLFASILDVLNLSEMGFSSAIVFNMYKPIAEDDNKTICALLNFYKKVYQLIGIFILFVGFLS